MWSPALSSLPTPHPPGSSARLLAHLPGGTPLWGQRSLVGWPQSTLSRLSGPCIFLLPYKSSFSFHPSSCSQCFCRLQFLKYLSVFRGWITLFGMKVLYITFLDNLISIPHLCRDGGLDFYVTLKIFSVGFSSQSLSLKLENLLDSFFLANSAHNMG